LPIDQNEVVKNSTHLDLTNHSNTHISKPIPRVQVSTLSGYCPTSNEGFMKPHPDLDNEHPFAIPTKTHIPTNRSDDSPVNKDEIKSLLDVDTEPPFSITKGVLPNTSHTVTPAIANDFEISISDHPNSEQTPVPISAQKKTHHITNPPESQSDTAITKNTIFNIDKQPHPLLLTDNRSHNK